MDPTWKAMWRWIGVWICQNHKAWYAFTIACACGLYNFWYAVCIGYYKSRNHKRSLDYAIQMEAEWDLIKPKEDEDDDEEEEEEE